jgi:hypothetical protein
MALWGLIMAKARASFKISDLLDKEQIKSKYSRIFYIVVMIAVA